MTQISPKQKSVGYIRMADGTKEDYLLEAEISAPFRAGIADRVLSALEECHEGFPGGQVDRYEHMLQTATRAHRAGADEEMVVASLLHDIGDRLASANHAELAAVVLRPYVTPAMHWLVMHHAIFQGYFFWHHYGKDRYQREKYKNHPCYEMTKQFTDEWDQEAFDPGYDTMALEEFEPMVRHIFGREPWGPHTKERIDEIYPNASRDPLTQSEA